jgi:hypothetical protein
MSISATRVLTDDQRIIHAALRVDELRAHDATQVPDGYVPLGLRALAARLGVSRMTAYRRMQALAGQQHRPDALRVIELPVPTGKGAKRLSRHVLWPVEHRAAA